MTKVKRRDLLSWLWRQRSNLNSLHHLRQ
jgi:hypothetical protein